MNVQINKSSCGWDDHHPALFNLCPVQYSEDLFGYAYRSSSFDLCAENKVQLFPKLT